MEKTMNKEAIKNKLVYFLSLTILCAVLISVAYFGFLRTVKIDLMSNMRLIYEGENKDASVVAINTMEDINQRIQAFYNSIHYTIEPDQGLSNGDTIVVKARYDESLAQQYHFEPENVQKEIVVEGLPNRYDSVSQMDEQWIDKIEEAMKEYLQTHQELQLETEIFDDSDQAAKLESIELEELDFLKSKEESTSDRMVGLYRMTYRQQDSVKDLYYLVIIPYINDSQKIDTQNIYGERGYLSEEEIENRQYNQYISRIFDSSYKIESIHLQKEGTETKTTEEAQ
ncbi:hypothetical protein C815_00454 [Firmicutes bacterium M10-2]|nr:hypothetical protein C815_00454 [Firmicutes bacterium M10-2]